MNYKSEKTLEREFSKDIEGEEIGGTVIKLLSTVSGLPDRLVLLPAGRAFFIEFKSTGKKPRKLQTWWHTKLTLLGFDVFVIHDEVSYNTVLNYVKDIRAKDIPGKDA